MRDHWLVYVVDFYELFYPISEVTTIEQQQVASGNEFSLSACFCKTVYLSASHCEHSIAGSRI